MKDSVIMEFFGLNVMLVVILVLQLWVSYVGRWVMPSLKITVINLVCLTMVVNMITMVYFMAHHVQRFQRFLLYVKDSVMIH